MLNALLHKPVAGGKAAALGSSGWLRLMAGTLLMGRYQLASELAASFSCVFF
jgi:hypothetical protein